MANHQGVVAVVDSYEYSSPDEILEKAALNGEVPFVLILDGIEDPQNLGSIIRTAKCAGVHGIIIPQHNSVEITPAVVRASAGAVEHMLVARVTNLVNCIKDFKKQGLWVVGADMDGTILWQSNLPAPTVLVVGGEGTGMRKLVRQHCDMLVSIPMVGAIGSLNASVAAGVVIYEVIRQRRGQDKP